MTKPKFSVVLVLLIGSLSACSGGSLQNAAATTPLPPGDVTSGQALFVEMVNGAPACSTCHTLTDQPLNGPGMGGYRERAATQVEGQSAEEHTRISIIQPAAHIVSGYGNIMYPLYGQHLTSQQIADLVAYLLTL